MQKFNYGLDDHGSILGSGSILSSPPRPDQLWGPPNPLSNWYHGLLTGDKAAGGVKLTIFLRLPCTLRMSGTLPPLPHVSS